MAEYLFTVTQVVTRQVPVVVVAGSRSAALSYVQEAYGSLYFDPAPASTTYDYRFEECNGVYGRGDYNKPYEVVDYTYRDSFHAQRPGFTFLE